jgi:polyisoprenoid-binding protein YceI
LTAARFAFAGLLCCAACSKPDVAPRRTEPWLAQPSASASANAVSGPMRFRLVSDSRIRFTVPGKRAKLSGRVGIAQGSLRLDPHDLKTASADIDVDLTTLSIDADSLPENAPLAGGSPSALALQWLELGADVAPERRREVGLARFELSSVESSSAPGIDLSEPKAKSHVRATVIGTLLIHGFRAPVRCEVVLAALEGAPGAPPRFSIRSQGALVVPLAPHDIRARGPSGIADAVSMARSAEWVGKNARVELELVAEADPSATK